MAVLWREEALNGLSDLYRFIVAQSGHTEQAWRFIQRIQARCERIGDVPHGGHPRDDLVIGLRTAPLERLAVIAYVVESDTVRVTNVFYGGRDYEALYRDHDGEE